MLGTEKSGKTDLQAVVGAERTGKSTIGRFCPTREIGSFTGLPAGHPIMSRTRRKNRRTGWKSWGWNNCEEARGMADGIVPRTAFL